MSTHLGWSNNTTDELSALPVENIGRQSQDTLFPYNYEMSTTP